MGVEEVENMAASHRPFSIGFIVRLSFLILTAFLSACSNAPENTQTFGASSCFPQGTDILVSSTNDIPNTRIVEAKTLVMVSKSGTPSPCGVMIPFLDEVRNQGGNAVIGFSSLVVPSVGPSRSIVFYGTAVVVEPIAPQ